MPLGAGLGPADSILPLPREFCTKFPIKREKRCKTWQLVETIQGSLIGRALAFASETQVQPAGRGLIETANAGFCTAVCGLVRNGPALRLKLLHPAGVLNIQATMNTNTSL